MTVSPVGSGMRASQVPNSPVPMITSGCCSRNRASRKVRDAAQQAPPRRAGKTRMTPKPSGAVEALQIVMTGDPAGPDIGTDGLAELVLHDAHALAVAPSAAVYGELLSARSFAGTLLGRSSPRQRPPGQLPWNAAGSCGRRWCWPESSTKRWPDSSQQRRARRTSTPATSKRAPGSRCPRRVRGGQVRIAHER